MLFLFSSSPNRQFFPGYLTAATVILIKLLCQLKLRQSPWELCKLPTFWGSVLSEYSSWGDGRSTLASKKSGGGRARLDKASTNNAPANQRLSPRRSTGDISFLVNVGESSSPDLNLFHRNHLISSNTSVSLREERSDHKDKSLPSRQWEEECSICTYSPTLFWL